MSKFKNPNDPDNTQIKALLAQWVTAKFQFSKGETIEIIEHACTEASCVHAETVFEITNPQNLTREYYKIAKPLIFIRKWDIDNLKKMTTPQITHRH